MQDGLLRIDCFRELQRCNIERASIRWDEGNACRIDDRSGNVALLYPVPDPQGLLNIQLCQVKYMRKAMAGQHVGHLLIKSSRSDRVGTVPFRLDKMDMAIPESGCHDHTLTGYDSKGFWHNDFVRAPYVYNFPVPDQYGAIFNWRSRRGRIYPGAHQGQISGNPGRLAKNGACDQVKGEQQGHSGSHIVHNLNINRE